MTSPFLEPNDPRLLQASQPVPVDAITGPDTRHALEQMHQVAFGEQSDRSKPVLVGVAASQIGIPKRIVLVDVAADGHGATGDLRTYINPVITEHSADTTEWYEGCYSTAPICGVLERPNRITVEAYDAEGNKITEQHEGYTARVFQHEMDHLDGKVFIDRVSDPSNLHVVKGSEYPKYRDQEGWRTWPAKASRAMWDELRTSGLGPHTT